jgi:hypothetical protein
MRLDPVGAAADLVQRSLGSTAYATHGTQHFTEGGHVMSEQRQVQRELTLKTEKIKSVDIRSHIECAILDISAAGVRILVPAGVDPPETFDLAVDPDGQTNYCPVVWKSRNRIGVSIQVRVQI